MPRADVAPAPTRRRGVPEPRMGDRFGSDLSWRRRWEFRARGRTQPAALRCRANDLRSRRTHGRGSSLEVGGRRARPQLCGGVDRSRPPIQCGGRGNALRRTGLIGAVNGWIGAPCSPACLKTSPGDFGLARSEVLGKGAACLPQHSPCACPDRMSAGAADACPCSRRTAALDTHRL
jgi:hypothetical protein